MDELCFRANDPKGRPRWVAIAVVLGLAVLRLVLDYLRSHELWELFVIPGVLLFVPLLVLTTRRGWTRVGWEGIRISWFGGRGRLIPWSEVRAIRIRTLQGNRSVQAVLANGRRRSLPGLAESTVFPDPALPDKVQQLNVLFERYTGSAQQVEDLVVPPPRVLRLRGSGVWQGVVAVLLLIPLVISANHVIRDIRAAGTSYLTVPAQVGAGAPVAGGHYLVTLESASDDRPLPPNTTAYFRSPDGLLLSLQYAQPVTVRISPDDWTVAALRPAGYGDWQLTVDSPQAHLSADVADLAPTVLLVALLAAWSVALVRARRRGTRTGFRWWVLLSVAPLPLLFRIVGTEENGWPAPFAASAYQLPALLLAAGLAMAAVLEWTRRRQRPADAAEPAQPVW